MNYETKEVPSVYHESYYRVSKGEFATGMITRFLLVILALFIVRTGNIILTYHINKRQLTQMPIIGAQNTFMGISSAKKAREEFERLDFSNPQTTTILCYYNLLQPGIFLISQKGPPQFQEFGPLAIYTPIGESKVSLLGQHFFNISHQKHSSLVYTGRAPLTPLILSLFKNVNQEKSQNISFAVKPLTQYPPLRIPYMVYFFLPLLLILILRTNYSPAIYLSFSYYMVAFLFFNPTQFFLSGPFHWIFSLLHLELPPHSIRMIIAILLTVFAGVAAFIGLINWKKSDPDSLERTYILSFLLLPLFLVF